MAPQHINTNLVFKIPEVPFLIKKTSFSSDICQTDVFFQNLILRIYFQKRQFNPRFFIVSDI